MPRPYIRLRETTFDLYVERDLLPGYFKAISTFASWSILAGYALFAVVFTTQDDDLNTPRNMVTAIAAALLVTGYLGIVMVAVLSRSLLFIIDAVIFPTLTASVVGLFLTVVNFRLRSKVSPSQLYMTVPLVTASVTTVVSAVLLGIAYRELWKIRKRDERRRWHLQLEQHTGSKSDPNAMIAAPSLDDEAQRRQLMRLLQDRQEALSNIDDANRTYKLDMPGQTSENRRLGPIGQQRGPSPHRGTFNLSKILPWNNAEAGTFKDPRERRREEIERSTMPHLQPVLGASEPVQPSQPATWDRPLATRYA